MLAGAIILGILFSILITLVSVGYVVNPAKELEQITQDRVWFAWRLAAFECIVTPAFTPLMFFVTMARSSPVPILLFLLLSPLVFILAISQIGKHSPYRFNAIKIVMARVVSAYIAMGLLAVTESWVVGGILIGFTLILTWGLLQYQLQVVRRELSRVEEKTVAEIDDVHDWEEEGLVKWLKEEESNSQ